VSGRIAVAGALVLLAAVGISGAGPNDDKDQIRRASLRTVEGSVTGVSSVPAEGDLQVVTVRLETADAEHGRIEILLAPEQVLDDVGFAVQEGDAFRARVFVVDQGPMKAHKVMNLTRGTIVRLRTLHEIPLWDVRGRWEGGPSHEGARSGAGRQGRGPGPKR
jgi:hypothetical protein